MSEYGLSNQLHDPNLRMRVAIKHLSVRPCTICSTIAPVISNTPLGMLIVGSGIQALELVLRGIKHT